MANFGFLLLINAIREDEERRLARLQMRELRDTSDPLSLPESTFKNIYRLSRQSAHDLIQILAPHMRNAAREEISLPKQLKIFVVLHLFGQGSYQKVVGLDQFISMSQSSISRCLHEVTNAINDHMNNLIKFPRTPDEKQIEKQRFMNLHHGFPGIIGAIDCTHVGIISPPVNDPNYPAILFLNRKGYYSINVQIICNAELKILAINSRYPGSVHDSAIWQTSAIKQELIRCYNNGDVSSWLIGDSGYPLQPWLMCPVISANPSAQERNYNAAHRSVRNVIERLNGVLKAKLRCLLKHRILHYRPNVAAKIINACAILHNFCQMRNDMDEEYIDNDDNLDPALGGHVNIDNNNWYLQGRDTRNRIIQNYF